MGEAFYYLQGEQQNMETLVARYGDALVRYAYCHTGNSAAAEDIAEDVFVALFLRHIHFQSEKQIKAWLYKTAYRKCIDYHRSPHRAYIPLSDLENVLFDDGERKMIDGICDNNTLYRCMQKLPEQYKEALCMCYFNGFSPDETARIWGKTKKQVYNLLSRAKSALSTLLKQEGIP